MFYYLYQITNKVNNKIYVGVHKTKSLDDGYMGSGKVIRSAIMKHGIENFEKVILEFFENQEAMYAKEKEVVNEEFLTRDDVYNLRRGGTGGFDYINKNCLNGFSDKDVAVKAACVVNKIRTKYHADKLNDLEYKNLWIKSLSDAAKLSYKNGRINSMKNKNHSDYSKALMRELKLGDNNPNYGKMWITNGIVNKMIKKTDEIPNGYVKGRNKL